MSHLFFPGTAEPPSLLTLDLAPLKARWAVSSVALLHILLARIPRPNPTLLSLLPGALCTKFGHLNISLGVTGSLEFSELFWSLKSGASLKELFGQGLRLLLRVRAGWVFLLRGFARRMFALQLIESRLDGGR